MADDAEQAEQTETRLRRRRARAALPATFTDSYSIDWSIDSVRISFAEALYEEWYYKVAVVLPVEDAENLGRSLLRITEQAKREREST